jgi:hypothetical protein
LDDLPDSCSSDAPPPPLKAYILSILNPILEEYADALFQTLRVKPLQLAESAVSDVVIAQAISPEVLERMKALNDPEVQKVLADFKANVKNAVQQSGEMLQKGVGDNIGNLLGDAVRQFTNSIKYAVADIPGWGIGMSVDAWLDAVLDAAKQAKVIEGEVVNALKPLNAVQAQVSAVTDAVNKATGATGLTSGEDLPLGKGQEGDVEMSGLGPNAASETTGESGDAASETTGLGEATSETTGLGEAQSGASPSGEAASPSGASPSGASPSAAPTLSTTVKGADGSIEMTELRPGVAASPIAASPSTASPSTASPSAATQNTANPIGEAASETTDKSAPALGNRTTPARRVGPQDTFATPLSKNPNENAARERYEDSSLGGGGSRKRRRIHKLSRRIERTLRRVQKKYGLQSNQGDQSNQSNQSNQGDQDKNGFLRRTLRHRKH